MVRRVLWDFQSVSNIVIFFEVLELGENDGFWV